MKGQPQRDHGGAGSEHGAPGQGRGGRRSCVGHRGRAACEMSQASSPLDMKALERMRSGVLLLHAGSRIEAQLPDSSAVIFTSPAQSRCNPLEDAAHSMLRHIADALPTGATVTAYLTDGTTLSMRAQPAQKLATTMPAPQPIHSPAASAGALPAAKPSAPQQAAGPSAITSSLPSSSALSSSGAPRLEPPLRPSPADAQLPEPLSATAPLAPPRAPAGDKVRLRVTVPDNLGPNRKVTITWKEARYNVDVPEALMPGAAFEIDLQQPHGGVPEASVVGSTANGERHRVPNTGMDVASTRARAHPVGTVSSEAPESSPPSNAQPPEGFQFGQTIKLVGLSTRPDLNGSNAVLISPADKPNRFNIRLACGQTVSLRPHSFMPCEAPGNASGDPVPTSRTTVNQAVLDAAWIEPLDEVSASHGEVCKRPRL